MDRKSLRSQAARAESGACFIAVRQEADVPQKEEVVPGPRLGLWIQSTFYAPGGGRRNTREKKGEPSQGKGPLERPKRSGLSMAESMPGDLDEIAQP